MFLLKEKRKAGIYLSIAQAYRDPVTKKSKRKRIRNLGYLKDLQKEYDDPIAHFTEVAEKMTTEYKNSNGVFEMNINFSEKINSDYHHSKSFGYVALSSVYHSLKINQFFDNRQASYGADYRLNQVMKLLTFGEILYPGALSYTYSIRHRFFEGCDYSLEDVYDFFTFLTQYRAQFKSWTNESICNTMGRNTDTVFYYTTTHYFEVDYNKWYEAKKDTGVPRPNPLVQMGLFVDKNRIPITYNLFKGIPGDIPVMGPIFERARSEFNMHRIIIVANHRGSGYNYLYRILKSGHGYIVHHNVRDIDETTQKYLLDDEGYRFMGNGRKIKSRILTQTIRVKNKYGEKEFIRIKEKQVFIFDDSYSRWETATRESILLMGKDLISANRNVSGYTGHNHPFDINQSMLMKEEILDGYYMFSTSELEMDDEEIINAYEDLWEVDELFKEKKNDYSGRPSELSWENHLSSFFMIRYAALIITRIIEHKTGLQYQKPSIIRSLKKCMTVNIGQNIFMTTYTDETLKRIGDALNIDFAKRYRTRQEIRSILNLTKLTDFDQHSIDSETP